MSMLLLNDEVVVFKDPFGSRTYRWWAERGLIHWEDVDSGAYGSQTVRDTGERMNALSEMLGNTRKHNAVAQNPQAYQEYIEYLERMMKLCRKAQDQGRPDDPAARRQIVEEARARRQSRLVVIPGLASRF